VLMKKRVSMRERYEYGGLWCVVDHWAHTWRFVPRWLENWVCDRFEQHLQGDRR
jgi:hypothetical protein